MTTIPEGNPPQRQVRATFDDTTLVVYQAYSSQIADAALDAGRFVSPFKLDRMTWIKPSFLWMMYRSGWATKPGQERVLALRISRAGLEQAFAEACLSHYLPDVHASHDDWLRLKKASPVRVQWDPERSIRLDLLPWRTIQIGLTGTAARSYVNDWIVGMTDLTKLAHEIHSLVVADNVSAAIEKLPTELPYPLPDHLGRIVGAT